MIIGIGSDLVSVGRMEKALAKRPALAARLLTPAELDTFARENRSAAYLAKRFAAKEAIAKALGCGIGASMSWQDVETSRSASGQPLVQLSGGALQRMRELGAERCFLSISDEAGLALACAVLEAD